MMKGALLLVFLVALLAACGSSKKDAQPAPSPIILPQAQTKDEWARRIVNLLLRPLNRDLQVVNGLSNPNILLYIINQNKTTLTVLNRRLGDLAQCSDKLVSIGPPPPASGPLQRANTKFEAACKNYGDLAKRLQKVVLFLSSGRSDVVAEGRKLLRSSAPTANAAAGTYCAAIRIAQSQPEFKRAGLQTSAC